MTHQPYDYAALGKYPKLLTFYAGWTAQRITSLVHTALWNGGLNPTSGLAWWKGARGEMDRLLLICNSWRLANADRPWPEELARVLHDLSEDFAEDGGWWSSKQADRERSQSALLDEPLLQAVSRGEEPFFPMLNLEEPEADRWAGCSVIARVARVVKLLGEQMACRDELRYGVGLSGLFHSAAIKDPRDLAESSMEMLRTLEVVAPGGLEAFLLMAQSLPSFPDIILGPSSTDPSRPEAVIAGGTGAWSFRPFSPDGSLQGILFIAREWAECLVRRVLECVFATFDLPVPPLAMMPDDCPEARKISNTLAEACASPTPSLDGENVFRKRGDKWVVRFNGGQEFDLDDRRGMIELACLLEAPGKTFSLMELLEESSRQNAERRDRQVIDEDAEAHELAVANPDASLGEKMDYQGLDLIRDALAKARRDLHEAKTRDDFTEQERLQEEIEHFRKVVRESVDKKGKLRYFQAPERKKALDSVRKSLIRIRDGKLTEYDPALGKHLTDVLHMDAGQYCYSPDPPITWTVKK